MALSDDNQITRINAGQYEGSYAIDDNITQTWAGEYVHNSDDGLVFLEYGERDGEYALSEDIVMDYMDNPILDEDALEIKIGEYAGEQFADDNKTEDWLGFEHPDPELDPESYLVEIESGPYEGEYAIPEHTKEDENGSAVLNVDSSILESSAEVDNIREFIESIIDSDIGIDERYVFRYSFIKSVGEYTFDSGSTYIDGKSGARHNHKRDYIILKDYSEYLETSLKLLGDNVYPDTVKKVVEYLKHTTERLGIASWEEFKDIADKVGGKAVPAREIGEGEMPVFAAMVL